MTKYIILKIPVIIFICIFIFALGQSSAETVNITVTGIGIDEYTIKNMADSSEIGTYPTNVAAEVDIGEGMDIEVILNNLNKTKENVTQV